MRATRKPLEQSWSPDDYRTYCGPGYDVVGAHQLAVMVGLGMRAHHTLLDIGCGSLRGGRFFLMYLSRYNYHGTEPNEWLVKDAITYEVGADLIDLKKPRFWETAGSVFQEAPQGFFDYALAQSVFSHAPCWTISRWFTALKKVLATDGTFAFTYVNTDQEGEEYQGEEWVYPPTVPGCVKYRWETIEKLAEEQGFSVKVQDIAHPNGQTWVTARHS